MRQRRTLRPDTFPFLAVLLSAMGSLILILMILDRRARMVALRKATQEQVRQEQKEKEKEREERERLRQQREALLARFHLKQNQLRQQKEAIDARQAELHQQMLATWLHWLNEMQEHQEKKNAQVEDLQAHERAVQLAAQQLLEQKGQLEKSEAKATQASAELIRLANDLTQLEKALAQVLEQRKRDEHTWSIVPYVGKRGMNQRPLYVECDERGLIFHPDRLTLQGLTLTPEKIRAEVERRTAAARKQYPNRQVYWMLLVRPEGISHYYEFQGATKGVDVSFGYEFVDPDWNLEFPDPPSEPVETVATASSSATRPTRQQPPRTLGTNQTPHATGNTVYFPGTGQSGGAGGPPGTGGDGRTGGSPGNGTGTGNSTTGGTGASGPFALTGRSGTGVPGAVRGVRPGFSGVPGYGLGGGSGANGASPTFGQPGALGTGGTGAGGTGPGSAFPIGSGNSGQPGSVAQGGFPGSGGVGQPHSAPGGNGPGGRAGSTASSGQGGREGGLSGSQGVQGGSPGAGIGEPRAGMSGGTGGSTQGEAGTEPGKGAMAGGPGAEGGTPLGGVGGSPSGLPGGSQEGTGGGGSWSNGGGGPRAGAGGGVQLGQPFSPGGATASAGQGNSDNGGGSGGTASGGEASAGGGGGQPGGEGAAQGGAPGNPGQSGGQGAPQGSAQGSVTLNVGSREELPERDRKRPQQPNDKRPTSEPQGGGGGGGDGEGDGVALPDPSAGLPGKRPVRPRQKVLRPAALHGDRDWVIVIECQAEQVTVPVIRFSLPTAQLGTGSGAEARLRAALEKLIERKQTTVLPGELPYRPMIRFLVHPEGMRTFHLIYPALESVPVPKRTMPYGPGNETAP